MTTSIPAIITVGGQTAKVGFLVFWALTRARSLLIASKHSLLFFVFALLCHGLLFVLASVRVTNSFIGPINKR
jgi:hypothetical protein